MRARTITRGPVPDSGHTVTGKGRVIPKMFMGFPSIEMAPRGGWLGSTWILRRWAVSMWVIERKAPPRVYHPPTSLSTPNLARELDSYPRCHALVGDLNVRLGRAYGDSQSTHPNRRAAYLSFAQRYSLSLVPPAGPLQSRTDHILSDIPTLRWAYRAGDTLDSDHGVIHARLPTRAPPVPLPPGPPPPT
jgi:hypothetical protein